MRATFIAALCAASILIGGSAMAQTNETIEDRNKAAVQAGFDAWAAGSGSPYQLLAEDAIWTILGTASPTPTPMLGSWT